jgi:hypothetical protein
MLLRLVVFLYGDIMVYVISCGFSTSPAPFFEETVPDTTHVLIMFIDLYMLNYPWNGSKLIMIYDLLVCCGIQFASILLRIFVFMLIKGIGL